MAKNMPEVKKTAPGRPGYFKNFGIGQEKESFLENLSLMLVSDMPVAQALKSMKEAVKSKRLLCIVNDLESDINSGSHFWEAFEKTGLFPEYVISLIKIGEESGRLSENLKLISRQQEKDRVLKQRIQAAMIYPAIVFFLCLTLGFAIAWFVLPRLASVFVSLHLKIPLPTRVLIAVGTFLAQWGYIVVPASIIFLITVFYLLFINNYTKRYGQALLFSIPGVGKLMRETEISRFGHLVGSLLGAGIPVVTAMSMLSKASAFYEYRTFFTYLKQNLEDGNSFQKSFASDKKSKRLIFVPVQQIIIAGEHTGKLEQIFLSIGKNYEERSEIAAQNLTVILEPLLLIFVWSGVAVVALAVILPLYNLIGGLGASGDSPAPIKTYAPVKIERNILKVSTSTTGSVYSTSSEINISGEGPKVRGTSVELISERVGVSHNLKFVNVHSLPEVNSTVVGKLYAGKIYNTVAKQGNWYNIIFPSGVSGWVLFDYVQIK